MKSFAIIGLAAGLLLVSAAYAQDAAVEAPTKAFADAFSKGDMAAAMATHVSTGATITDELPPYRWSGATSFTDWGASFAKDAAAKGLTDPSVSIGAPIRELIDGDTAYVIAPSVYTFKQKGVAMREVAQMTFALTRTASGWKIAAWTWTGPNPTPVK